MLRFDNPGHREQLQALGILDIGQIDIVPDVLAERLLASAELEAGLYILRQEIRTKMANLSLWESQAEMTEAMVRNIFDRISLKDGIERVIILNSTFTEAFQTAEGLNTIAVLITSRLTTIDSTLSINATIIEHIHSIIKFADQALSFLSTHHEAMNQQILTINEIIEAKKREYGS